MSSRIELVTVLFLAVLTGLIAQEKQSGPDNVQQGGSCSLKVGVGIAFKRFKDISIKGGSFVSSKALYENKNLGAMTESKYSTTASRAKGDENDTNECFSPTISGAFCFYKKENLSLSIAGNFQYYDLENKGGYEYDNTVETYYSSVLHPELGSVLGESSFNSSVSSIKTELKLYEHDLGVRTDYSISTSFSLLRHLRNAV